MIQNKLINFYSFIKLHLMQQIPLIKSNIILIITIFLFNSLLSQGIPIGEWRDHLPYRQALAVADAGDRVYCATTSSLFYYRKDDNSLNRVTKINGLSDIGIATINFHTNTQTLIIAYQNSNIDLLVSNRIINVSDIKRKNIPGKKNINKILFVNNFAYLSCGFGIVELDLMRQEIKNTYHIGPLGERIEVFDMAFGNNTFFAATEQGIFYADKDVPNLANYEYWQKDTSINNFNDMFTSIVYFGNKLVVNRRLQGTIPDTIYYKENGQWNYFDTIFSNKIQNIVLSSGKMVISYQYYVRIYDEDFNMERGVYEYNGSYAQPKHAIYDSDNKVWIADNRFGMVRYLWEMDNSSMIPNGPSTSNVFKMTVEKGQLWVAPGLRDESTWNNIYNQDGIFSFIDETWATIDRDVFQGFDTIHDIVTIAVDPNDTKRVYAGSWRRGLLEFYNGQFVQLYDDNNSTLAPSQSFYWIGIGGLAFDNNNNLWITNSSVTNVLSVKTYDNQWFTYNFPSLVNDNVIGEIVIDQYNQKWVIIGRGNGILVFDDNNTLSNTSDDRAKKLTTAVGNGNLPSSNVVSMAVDRNGEIWVGTDKGIAVFYSPGNVFSTNNFDAQQILVTLDGFNQYLLESETVTAIAVDGANNKWVGTSSSGVFYLSADGTEEKLHFNTENSPLFSNSIKSIAINHETAEVFFGTAKGIISYKGTATQGSDEFTNVYAYPNPVRENYNGYIAIKGLVTDVDVKITDITGNLVYSTIANGGQAIWNGRNLNGEKVKTGVYLVFCSNTDGSKTFVTKILFIN